MFPVLFLPFFFEVPAVLYLGVWFFVQLFSGTLALASCGRAPAVHIICAAARCSADATR
jgi:membrane associated rhomboid family serine protease